MLIVRKNIGYFVSIFVGGILGCGIYFVQPTTWRGEVIFSVGFAIDGTYNKFTPYGLSESLPVTIERIKSQSFIEDAAKDLGKAITAEYIKDHLEVRPLKDGQSLTIIVDTSSKEKSLSIINAMVNQLLKRHDSIVDIVSQQRLKALENERKQKAYLETQKEDLLNFSRQKSLESLASTSLTLVSIQQEIISANRNIQSLEEFVASVHNARVLERPSVEKRRLFPSFKFSFLIGSLIALMFFVLSKKLNKL